MPVVNGFEAATQIFLALSFSSNYNDVRMYAAEPGIVRIFGYDTSYGPVHHHYDRNRKYMYIDTSAEYDVPEYGWEQLFFMESRTE